MSNQRKRTKKQVGFYAEPHEIEAIKRLAEANKMDVTALLRAIAREEIILSRPAKKRTG